MNLSQAGLRLSFFPENALKDWRLTRPELRVLMALSCFTNGDTGHCRPSQTSIGKIAGLTREKVNVMIKDLVALGYLVQLQRRRCWVYQIMNPEIPKHGTVPRGGTLQTKKTTAKKFIQGVHDPVPTGGTHHVPTGGTQTPRTPLNPEEDKGAPLTGEHIAGADAAAPLGATPLPAGKEAGKFFTPLRPRTMPDVAPPDPLARARMHMSRNRYNDLITEVHAKGQSTALQRFGFDQYGRKLKNVYA